MNNHIWRGINNDRYCIKCGITLAETKELPDQFDPTICPDATLPKEPPKVAKGELYDIAAASYVE